MNDNKPVFPKKSYQFTVKEDEKVDYVLAEQFNAHDADIEVRYLFIKILYLKCS